MRVETERLTLRASGVLGALVALVVLVLEFLVGALARDLVVLGDLLVVLERTLVDLVDLTRLGLDGLASLPPGAN